MRLDSVIEKVRAIPMGGTDCSLSMVWARRNQARISGFVTYTDSETWAGNIHPAQALRQYRDEFVGDAKAVVVGTTPNVFTVADPNDRGMLDIVGFDTSVPVVISDFVRAARRLHAGPPVQGLQEGNSAGGSESFRPFLRTVLPQGTFSPSPLECIQSRKAFKSRCLGRSKHSTKRAII